MPENKEDFIESVHRCVCAVFTKIKSYNSRESMEIKLSLLSFLDFLFSYIEEHCLPSEDFEGFNLEAFSVVESLQADLLRTV